MEKKMKITKMYGQEHEWDGRSGNAFKPNASTSRPGNLQIDASQTPNATELANGAGQTPTENFNNAYLQEIQRAVKNKNYKALLNADVNAYNMKMNAEKYLGNALASQGMSTQGYGTSAQVGLNNQLMSMYAQNRDDYIQAEDASSAEADNQLATFLQYSDGSDESIANYMGKYGYTLGEDGVWKDKDGNPASAYIQSAVQSAKENAGGGRPSYGFDPEKTKEEADAFLEAYAVSGQGYDMSQLWDLEVTAQDNKTTQTLNEVVGHELGYLERNLKNYQDGTLIKLGRGSNHQEAYLFLLRDGKLYLVSNDDNEQAGGQVDTRYNEYKGPKVSIVGK